MDYNPLLPEVQKNPYPYYTYLRHHAPVSWVESLQGWVVSRYSNVDYVLKNPQLFSSSVSTAEAIGDLNPVPEVPWLVSTDPPAHARVRKLVSRAFATPIINTLEPHILAITNQLLAHITSQREFDFVRDLSVPLPVTVIAEMLGVEPERHNDFKRWSEYIVSATNRPTAEEERARIRQSNTEFRSYFQQTIAQRRKHPREDLISALVRAEQEQQMLSSDEILALTVFLLISGNETTTNLLGNAILTLLDHADELTKVRADRALVPQLIEEVLRYDSPLQVIFRQATRDVELVNTKIPAGASVFLLLGSANRDEQKFPDPDRFDVGRNSRDHLAFGYGIHYCLGAQLARLEAKIALEALLFACPRFRRTTEYIPRIASLMVRGPKTLPLAFDAR